LHQLQSPSDVNKDWMCKVKDKDQAYKNQEWTRTRINITAIPTGSSYGDFWEISVKEPG